MRFVSWIIRFVTRTAQSVTQIYLWMQSRTSLDPRLPVFSSRSESETTKKEKVFQLSPFSTQTRGRTGMEVNPLVFETSASTDSAIWAN